MPSYKKKKMIESTHSNPRRKHAASSSRSKRYQCRVIHSKFFHDYNLLLAVVLSVSLITWLVSYFYLSNTVRPKTMLQIMDKNSDTVDWIRSSSLDIEKIMASNKKSCKQFFAHCCLGQAREIQDW